MVNILAITVFLRQGELFSIVWIKKSLNGHLLKSISMLLLNRKIEGHKCLGEIEVLVRHKLGRGGNSGWGFLLGHHKFCKRGCRYGCSHVSERLGRSVLDAFWYGLLLKNLSCGGIMGLF
jgi:hypothetical protein